MGRYRVALRASACALSFALMACGGGGGGNVNSTPRPTPTPTPAPSPTPSPTPTPTPAPTPTPSPTPTPTPTPTPPQTGTSLVNPTLASSHPTQAVKISGSLSSTGAAQSDVTTGAQSLTISIDPATGTYTLTRPGGNKQFSNVTAIDQTAPNMVYGEFVKTVPGGQENLFVTLPPGTSTDRLNWVGQGIYFSLIQRADGTYVVDADAFHYGYPTAPASVPTSGGGTYNVYVLGFLTEEGQNPILMRTYNPGTLTADFGAGTVSVSGLVDGFDLVNSTGGFSFAYNGDATIGSSGFNGDFTLGGIGGTWAGLFYGPSATEVGASFRGGSSVVDYAGTLVGSSDPGFRNIASSFAGLNDPADFEPIVIEELENVTQSGSTISTNFFRAGTGSGILGNYGVSYRNPGVWSLANTFTYTDSDKNASLSNDRYTVYGDVNPAGGQIDGLTLLNTAPGNSLVELTYTKFGIWERGGNGSGDYEIARRYAVFGFKTDPSIVPTTGSATYNGVVVGAAKSTGVTNRFYDLTGTTEITVNFGTFIWNGQLALTGTDRQSSATRDFGSFISAPGSLTGNQLQPAMFMSGGDPYGQIFGYLFGPGAAEVGGGFALDFDDLNISGNTVDIDGIFAGAKN